MAELQLALSISSVVLLFMIIAAKDDERISTLLFIYAALLFPRIVIYDLQDAYFRMLFSITFFAVSIIFGFLYRKQAKQ